MIMISFGQRHFSLMVLYAIALHYVLGVALLSDPSVALADSVRAMRFILPFPLAGLSMIAAASLAGWAFFMRQKWMAALMMIPQQFLLFAGAGGGLQAIMEHHLADEVGLRPIAFVIAVQAPTIIAAVGHTLAIISIAWNEPS